MLKKGFTLIELLVVIAIMAVISAAVLVAIDPIDKINAANDSRSQADIGQVASAVTAYATSNNGSYPAAADWGALGTALTTAGELTKMPVAPGGYTYTASSQAAGPVVLSATLKSKKYAQASPTPLPFWNWCSTSAVAGAVATASTCP